MRVPAYLHIDSLSVNQPAANAPSTDAGWYTSDIDAVQLIAYFDGEKAETIFGTFELPCRVPILYEGTAQYVRVIPVVRQNGIAQTRIEYPYFCDTILKDITFTANKTTHIGQLDTATGRYWLPIYYKPISLMDVLVYDAFEPLATSIVFDTTTKGVAWIQNDREHAQTGSGYLKVTTDSNATSVEFPITTDMVINDPTKILYLEMDYHTDVHLRIGISSPYTSGGQRYTNWAITLYPRKTYGKIYINLGKLWSQFNYYPNFSVIFSTLNTTGLGGDTYIDNLKIFTI
ncbi:MAG: hypothetical protein IJ764_07295 [Bacteroidales bacterium]|nr:hypothetical protein [Bacteroidales bacterium]